MKRKKLNPFQEPWRLCKILENAWSKNTSADPEHWRKDSPAWGQCAVTALVVQDYFGGELLRTEARMSWSTKPISHYFNLLPDGRHIDLSRQQFPLGTNFSTSAVRAREYVLDPKFSTRKRYRLLKRRISRILKNRRLA